MPAGLFWKFSYEWPDGHRIEPYGSGDFVPVCPENGKGPWLVQGVGALLIDGAAGQCRDCGAEIKGEPKQLSTEHLRLD